MLYMKLKCTCRMHPPGCRTGIVFQRSTCRVDQYLGDVTTNSVVNCSLQLETCSSIRITRFSDKRVLFCLVYVGQTCHVVKVKHRFPAKLSCLTFSSCCCLPLSANGDRNYHQRSLAAILFRTLQQQLAFADSQYSVSRIQGDLLSMANPRLPSSDQLCTPNLIHVLDSRHSYPHSITKYNRQYFTFL